MKVLAQASLILTLFVSVSSATADLNGVREVSVVGNRRVDAAALVQQFKATPGTVAESTITEDIKTLYRTGFFDQVSASTSAAPGGGIVLSYVVVEKPLVRKVFIKGNKEVSESDLNEALSVGNSRFLDQAQIQALIKNAITYYQGQGFYDVIIENSVVPVAENQVDLTFSIDEGPRYRIRKIRIEGLKEIDEDDVLGELQTQRYRWWSSWLFGTGRLNREMLDNDRTIVRQYMLDQGFVDAQVGEPLVEKRDDGLLVTIRVDEGDMYHIGSVSASGDLIDGSVEKTIEPVELKRGDTFSASVLREDTFRVSDLFTDKGYAFANVIPNTLVDRSSKTVDLEFNIAKGDEIFIRRIQITGNEKTYDHVIRRELVIGEHEKFSSSKIRRSQTLLQRLGYFEEASMTTEKTEKPNEVDLNINVREASTGTLSAGAGFSSSDGVLFNTRVSEANLFGTGRSVLANVDIGDRASNLILSYDDRRFNDSYWAFGADLIRSEREFSDFDRTQTGGALSVGHPLDRIFGEWAEDIRTDFEYELFEYEISEVNPLDAAQLVIDSEGTSTVSAITPSLTRNTIDNPLNPTSGSQQWLSAEFAVLGGSERYYLLEAQHQFYRPLFDSPIGKFVFSWRTKAGYGETFDDEPLPLFRRFFPGGINSVRGFKNRTLGPKDDNGNEYGGSKQLVNNLEIIFPLFESVGLKGVVFYDIGQAFDDDVSIKIEDLREAYGAGLRWSSPLGPIRIEFGFPMDREEGEKSMVTLFSFGAPL